MESASMCRKEVMKAMNKHKCDKAAGMNGINAEVLKYGGATVLEWMLIICNLAWRQRRIN